MGEKVMWAVVHRDGNRLLFKTKREAEAEAKQIGQCKVTVVYIPNNKSATNPIMYQDARELCVQCCDNTDFENNFDPFIFYIVRSYSGGTNKDTLEMRFVKSEVIGVEDRFGQIVEIPRDRFVLKALVSSTANAPVDVVGANI